MLDHVDNGNYVESCVERQLLDVSGDYFDSAAGRICRGAGRLYAILQKIARQGIQEVPPAASHVEDHRISGGASHH